MSNYYLDSSALLKRYVREIGSVWVNQISSIAYQHSIFTSELTIAETAAVLAAKSRAPGGISKTRYKRLLSRFLEDCEQVYTLIPVQRLIIDRAVLLSQVYRLRGYDSVQLATAITARNVLMAANSPVELIFVASDNDLLVAAQGENLLIEAPENH